MSALSTMVGLRRLLAGFAAITKAEFGEVVKSVLRTDDGYVDGCWGHFADNPLSYCLSRRPESQGNALVELAAQKARLLPWDTQPATEARLALVEDVATDSRVALQLVAGCKGPASGNCGGLCEHCRTLVAMALEKAAVARVGEGSR